MGVSGFRVSRKESYYSKWALSIYPKFTDTVDFKSAFNTDFLIDLIVLNWVRMIPVSSWDR